MSEYSRLEERIDAGEVILLDGAVGTQLQQMGVPMNNIAWAAAALQTHPATVQLMHEQYIKAGIDILTTNSYAAGRQTLEPLGLGDLVTELNRRAVLLAREARDKAAKDRPVLIAGSISNYGMSTGGEGLRGWRARPGYTEAQLKANLREQAETLVEAGVDFLLAESTGSNTHRSWISEACKATGVPFWVGFKVRREEGDAEVRTGYGSKDRLEEALPKVMAQGGRVLSIFHSGVADTAAALEIARRLWPGPLGAYPDAERKDYVAPYRDEAAENRLSPAEFRDEARRWVESGVQIIGGCCGYGLPYIRGLREALPKRIAAPRRSIAHAA
jgi:S-methylmethionine-dependent homocysteine/selenocysteine methylase